MLATSDMELWSRCLGKILTENLPATVLLDDPLPHLVHPNSSWQNAAKDAGKSFVVVRLLAPCGFLRALAQPSVLRFAHGSRGGEAASEVLARVADHEVEAEPSCDRLVDDHR